MPTQQEVNDSPILKIVNRALKQDYPWIIEFESDTDPNRYDTTIFLDVYFEPNELASEYNMELRDWVWKYYKNKGNIMNKYGSLDYILPPNAPESLSNFLNDIHKDITKQLKTLTIGDIIPKQFKEVLKGGTLNSGYKLFNVSSYIASPRD